MGDKLSSWCEEFVRSRAAAGLLLLALTAHAFVASATHFHSLVSTGASPAQAALQGREERGQSKTPAGEDKQCLLCRLQRNLISDTQHATLLVAPPPVGAPGHDLLWDDPSHATRTPLRPGRAPPPSTLA